MKYPALRSTEFPLTCQGPSILPPTNVWNLPLAVGFAKSPSLTMLTLPLLAAALTGAIIRHAITRETPNPPIVLARISLRSGRIDRSLQLELTMHTRRRNRADGPTIEHHETGSILEESLWWSARVGLRTSPPPWERVF